MPTPSRVFSSPADFQDPNNPVVLPSYTVMSITDALENEVCHCIVTRPKDRIDMVGYFSSKFADIEHYKFPLTMSFIDVEPPSDAVVPDF